MIKFSRAYLPAKQCSNYFEGIMSSVQPQSIAAEPGDAAITYEALNSRANQLGHYLQAKGITTESRVAACMNRSLEMLIAILGILKAGGAYVPIDPFYPQERISYMLGRL